MHYNARKIIFAVSVITILITSVLGQTIPASGMLEKRNYAYLTDQHLTARLGNSKVCGDHMCVAGEWSKLQENLNKAQIGHGSEKNFTKTTPSTTAKVNSTSSATPAQPVQPVPTPIPTPPVTPYSVCKAVKETLANSTVSSDVVAKIMTDLSCSK